MRLPLAVLALVSGCDMYWSGGGGGDDICHGDIAPARQGRNPFSGTCEVVSGGCDPCEPCNGGGTEINMPACTGPCAGLDEQQCLATTNCHAEYDDTQFAACWEQMPGGDAHDGVCSGLDGWTCADHDNCASVMNLHGNPGVEFDHCIAEPGGLCSVDVDCGADQSCDTSTCHQAPCPDCPTCGACAPTCYGVCVPKAACSTLTTEAACTARGDCVATYTGYDCTCVGNVCTCKNEVFASCAPR